MPQFYELKQLFFIVARTASLYTEAESLLQQYISHFKITIFHLEFDNKDLL